MNRPGKFYGIGVGPGEPEMLPVAAWRALQTCEVILAPRAESAEFSVARHCLRGLEIAEERIREITFTMSSDRNVLRAHYTQIAREIADDLRKGSNVAYLTIGDALTYSTYGYALAALLDELPEVEHRTFPGITSYAAVSAATGWPLGEGKERVLILPCPNEMQALQREIETHDIVVLMKIGDRLPSVLGLLNEMGIAGQCAFGARIGLPGGRIVADVHRMDPADTQPGYLSTMLIRKSPRERRHTAE